jgi:hypothetical protein
MALSRVKTWGAEVLYSADLNAEFNNILNNALALISPLTGNLDVNSNSLTSVNEAAFADSAADATAAGRLRRNGQRLTWHDGSAARVLPVILSRDVTVFDNVSSAAETTVYTFTVPANTLSTTRALDIRLWCDFLNNSGANRTLQIRLKYGATTWLDVTSSNIVTSATRYPIFAQAQLSAANATNAQYGAGQVIFGNTTGVSGVGVGGQGNTSNDGFIGVHNALAEDSTTALALAVTFQNSFSAATVSSRCLAVQVTLL